VTTIVGTGKVIMPHWAYLTAECVVIPLLLIVVCGFDKVVSKQITTASHGP